MGTTIIFPSYNARTKRMKEAVDAAERKILEDEITHMDELISRVVSDLQSGNEVKIVERDGAEVIAKKAAT